MEGEESGVLQLKLLIIGESGVGKTSILQRFIENKFQKRFTSTIGIDFRAKTVAVGGEEVELQIWDTAGQERFFSITKSYYRGADGIFLVFDLSSAESFKNREKWIAAIRSKADENVPIVLIGNKKDLLPEGSAGQSSCVGRLEELAKELRTPWYLTSAQSGENIEEIFLSMAQAILAKKKKESPPKKPKKKFFLNPHSINKRLNSFNCC